MADDLDFDAVERLLEEESSKPAEVASTRDRDRDRSDRGRDRDRSRRSRSRDRRRKERRSRTPEEEKARREEERTRREQERRERQLEEERQKQVDQAKRDDCTVLVMRLHHQASEREVYEYFSAAAGKVRDVQVIRDSRTNRSKGVAYVEFYLTESVLKALACSGQLLMGSPIMVQASQAEKNRQANNQKVMSSTVVVEQPVKLFVGGLVDTLENITESELRKLFEPFGDIDYIDLHTDPYTGKCKGYAYVQYKSSADAREAMATMNGFDLAGQQIRVGIHQQQQASPFMLTGGDLMDPKIQDPNKRLELMHNLSQSGANRGMEVEGTTTNLVLRNMFDPEDPEIKDDPEFFTDVHEDVTAECAKHGPVDKVWIDRVGAKVWVRFKAVEGSNGAKESLHGRWFAGKQIQAEFTSDRDFDITTAN